MPVDDFKRGDEVTFTTGRSGSTFRAKVTGKSECGLFLITKDADGKERKVRPGSCTKL